ncbi:hypothetical protein KI387_009501, partial [Taxus chinensis]
QYTQEALPLSSTSLGLPKMNSEEVTAAMASDVENLTITPSGHTIENSEEPKMPKVDWAKYSKRVVLKKIVGRPDGGTGLVGERVVVGGWVKSGREQGKTSFAFLEVNDANCPPNVQARIPLCLRSLMRLVTGANNNNSIPDGNTNTNTSGGAGNVNSIKSSGSMKAEPTPGRTISSVACLQVNDGSCSTNLQVIVDSAVANIKELTPTGTSILVEGVLKLIPEGTKKKIELKVQKVLQVGTVDPAKYPITKTRLPLEFLRNYVHLRPRTNTISSVARIRNALAYATHTFFQNHGFLYVHTPIITTSHSQGAGEAFQVTTLFSEADRVEREMKALNHPTEADLQAAKDAVTQKTEALQELKKKNSDKASIDAALEDLNKGKTFLSKLEETCKLKPGIPQKDGKFDYSRDFFSRQAYLTLSGQLHVESYACALSSVYTFGPTFRAESSQNTRYLAEYWMVEPEIAFADLEDAMNCAEDFLKFLCQWMLDNCLDDMKFMANQFDKTIFDRLRLVASTPFARITYTEAVDLLKKVPKFENKIEWGINFTAQHERCLTEEILKKPVIVYDHPKQVKPFHTRLNDDGKTVASMDVLVPKVGGLMGGSQREERYEVLEKRIEEVGLPREPYEWYLDLRRYGTVKHSGFGLGFESM